MSDRYDELRAAAAKASNGNLDTAERITVGEIQCPLCNDGVIDHKTWTNIDDKPLGIEVFGLGEALTNYETFVHLANPETIQAILSERESLLAEAREAVVLDALTRAQLTIVQDENDKLRAALKAAEHDLVCTGGLRATDLTLEQVNAKICEGVSREELEFTIDNSKTLALDLAALTTKEG